MGLGRNKQQLKVTLAAINLDNHTSNRLSIANNAVGFARIDRLPDRIA